MTTTEIINRLAELEIVPEGGRATYMYANYSIIHMYSRRDKVWPLDIVGGFGVTHGHLTKWYFGVKDQTDFLRTLDYFLTDPTGRIKQLKDYVDDYHRKGIKLLATTNFSTIDRQTLVQIAAAYYEYFELLLVIAGQLRLLDRALLLKLKDIFPNNFDQMVRVMSVANEASYATQEELALLELAAKTSANDLTAQPTQIALGTTRDTYCWSTVGYYNEKARTLVDYQAKLQELIANNPVEKIAAIQKELKKQLAEREELMGGLSEEAKTLAYLASNSSYLKDYFKFALNHITYLGQGMFEVIARQLGLSVDQAQDLLPAEMAQALTDSSFVIDKVMIEERLKDCVVLTYEDQFVILNQKESVEFEKRFVKIDDMGKTEFKGRIASRGHAKGKAKIILSPDDFHLLEEGDILVVTNTSPDFVPIMRRAGAIVAEDGGLTAHVSVVSREFGIPCIVGISHATTLLPHGAFIEVDADSGVVKILKF